MKNINPLVERAKQKEAEARSITEWLEVCRLYEELRSLDPGCPRLAANCGNNYWLAGRPESALACYQQAVVGLPNNALVYRGLGNALVDLGRWEAAARAYRRSLQLERRADTLWNLSQLLIGLGDFAEGYALAECRWQLAKVERWREPMLVTAEDCVHGDQPLLIWSEQGLGDTLQHLRWLGPLQQARGREALPITLEVEPCLERLLRALVMKWRVRATVRSKSTQGPSAWHGAHLSLLSLPHLLGGAPVPRGALWLDHGQGAGFERARAGRARIGLVWAAGRKLEEPVSAREYWLRSLDQSSLGHLIEGIQALGHQCVLLQFGEDRQLADPWRASVEAELPADADFLETAEWVSQLDLVICVDTAMAHLAGCLQKAVWLLLPFSAAPRWQREIATTPWYPTMRLFRQQRPCSWQEPIQSILDRLAGADALMLSTERVSHG